MLVPAGLLIMLMLGAIAFDLSLVYLRQRQAASTAVDVANDLATLALDTAHLRATGDYRLDGGRAAQLAEELARSGDVGAAVVDVQVNVLGPETIEVVVTLRADYVFAKAIPGAADGTEVRARATALALAG